MRLLLSGLAGSLLWAQLVWDWHAEQDSGKGYQIATGQVSLSVHRRKFQRLAVVGDHLYVLGNACVRPNDTLFLSSTDEAKQIYRNTHTSNVAIAYVAVYGRWSGLLEEVYYAHVAPNENIMVRFVDFAVSEDGDTLWIGVDYPENGGCRPRPSSGSLTLSSTTVSGFRWQAGGMTGLNWSTPFAYTLHRNAEAVQVWQVVRPGVSLSQVEIHWTNSSEVFKIELESLVREPGAVYVNGTLRRPDNGAGGLSLSMLHNILPSISNSEQTAVYVLRLSTGSSLQVTHAACYAKAQVSAPFWIYARQLLLRGDTLWSFLGLCVGVGADFNNRLLHVHSTGMNSAINQNLSGLNRAGNLKGRVVLTGLRKADLQPHTTSSGAIPLAQLWDYDANPAGGGGDAYPPPMLYAQAVEDTLYVAWSDQRATRVPTSSASVYSGSDRVYLMGWAGLSTYGSLWNPLPGWPVVSGVTLTGVVSGLVRWGDTLWLSIAHQGMSSGSPLWRVIRQAPTSGMISGYALRGLMGTVEVGGLTVDPHGHLYMAGIGRGGTYEYTRVRPNATSVTVSLTSPYLLSSPGYGRGWVGRLLNYRYQAQGSSLSRCIPDTLQSPSLLYTLWGRFDAGENIAFTWEGPAPYAVWEGFRWMPGLIYTVPSNKVDSLQVNLPYITFPGSGGAEIGTITRQLHPRLLIWKEPHTLQREGSSPSLQSQGHTLPPLYRADSTERWWVVPFLGDASKSTGWRSLGASFHRRAGYIDGNASLKPHHAFAYVPYHPARQEEGVYVVVNYTDSVLLYWLSMQTGMVERERGWPRLDDHLPGWEVRADTIVGGIQQLYYSPHHGHLYAVEGAYRMRAISLMGLPDSLLTLPRSRRFFSSTSLNAYSLQYQPGVIAGDPKGNLFTWVREYNTTSNNFWRTLLMYESPGSQTESFLAPASDSCMADGGLGSGGRLGSIRAMAAWKDTLYLLDWGPWYAGSCDGNNRLALRRIDWSSNHVQTLHTFYQTGTLSFLDSMRLGLIYQRGPVPNLLIALPMRDAATGERRDYILRYWLDGRSQPLDTLVGGGPTTGCKYGLDRLVPLTWPHNISFAVNRSGMLLFSGEKEIRAALPFYINRQGEIDRTTWQTVANLQAAQAIYPRSVALQSTGTTLSWAVDSVSSSGEGSLTLRLSICGSSATERHQTMHYFLRMPQFLLDVTGPDTVCQGEIFHGEVSFGGNEFLSWQLFLMGKPEECSAMALFDSLRIAVSPSGRAVWLLSWQAGGPVGMALAPVRVRHAAVDTCTACQYEAVVSGLQTSADSMFFRAFFGRLSDVQTFSIRRGHQLRLRLALEGPAGRAISGQQRLAPHPLLTRLAVAESREYRGAPLGDSLWILPSTPRGSLERWRRIKGEPLASDTTAHPEAWRHPVWAAPCRIELREGTPDGPVVENIWGLIDTLGWVWPLLPPMVDSTDAPADPRRSYYRGRLLSFCRCDTTTPKWIVVRLPNHIALRSAGPLSLSNGLLSNDPNQPATIDLTDPTYLDGIPGYHYAIVPDSLNPGSHQAAAWTGNIDDCYGPHRARYGGQDPPDCSRVNAADWEMLLPRNGITSGIYTIADLDGDGDVDALDATLLISNENQLREGVVQD